MHNLKYETAKKKLTRARKRALKILVSEFPNDFRDIYRKQSLNKQ